MNKIEIDWQELPYLLKEEMKVLRTNLKFTGADKRVLMITSVVSGEGKSHTALNLAASFAELGHSVLLVDTDMRRSALKDMLKSGDVSQGLSLYLSSQCGLDTIFCETDNPNVYVIPAGAVPPNPSELLANERMETMLQWARGQFDYVIVDSPPLGMVTDAAVIAPMCDGAILLLEWGSIRCTMAQDVVARLRNTGVSVLGAIINKVDHTSARYYSRYGYRRYGYSRYGYRSYGYRSYGYYKREKY